MSRKIIVYDDFYKDPQKIRSMVGKDHLYANPLICSDFNDLIVSLIGAHTTLTDNAKHGCFDLSTSVEPETISFSLNSKWSGIVFLTPDDCNPDNNSVSFWKNKETNTCSGNTDSEHEIDKLDAVSIIAGYRGNKQAQKWQIDNLWHKDVSIAGKFNRAIFFRSDLYHSIASGFGTDFDDGKLVQLFFFGDNNESN